MIHCGVSSVFGKSLIMCVSIRKMVKEGFFDIRGAIDNSWVEVLSVRTTIWSSEVREPKTWRWWHVRLGASRRCWR
jgi:hypothetical protein